MFLFGSMVQLRWGIRVSSYLWLIIDVGYFLLGFPVKKNVSIFFFLSNITITFVCVGFFLGFIPTNA